MPEAELLAPAGSFDCARAAVSGGADAVYMGGTLYSARAYAESGQCEMLSETIDYCHLRGVKVYMTLNTLMKERETETLYEYLLPYYRAGIDAVIVQDLGVLRFLKKEFPELPLHASTQMTVTGPYYAEALRRYGVCRVILARELSLAEIRDIHENTAVELEVFIHGALCYGCSGQCLLSSMLGGRSGNRGRCAGTCRLPYRVPGVKGTSFSEKKEIYPLCMKDFNTLARLPEILAAGVSSLKVEGRMKPAAYVGAVTAVYRRYLDKLKDGGTYRVDAADRRILSELSTRGLETDGYLDRHNGADMIALSGREEGGISAETEALFQKRYPVRERRLSVSAEASFRRGEPARMTLSLQDGGLNETVTAESVYEDHTYLCEAAKDSRTAPERIRENLEKFGQTPFRLTALSLQADDGLFVPVREVNALRRKAAELLSERILARSRRSR